MRDKARRLRKRRKVVGDDHAGPMGDYSVWVGWTWKLGGHEARSGVPTAARWVYCSITNDILPFRAKGPLSEEAFWSGGWLAGDGSGLPSTTSDASAVRPSDIVWRRDFPLETRDQQKAFVRKRIADYLQAVPGHRSPVVQRRKWIHCLPVTEYRTPTTGR